MFDRYVIVDWSASSVPRRGRDSIWIAVRSAASGRTSIENYPTRVEARDAVRATLHDGGDRGRTLVGWDFALGYPAGFAAAAGLSGDGPAWRSTWDHLVARLHDAPDNRNDRFAVAAELDARVGPGPGPFWGCPPSAAGPSLRPTKAGRNLSGLEELRETERRLLARGQRVSSVWQLLGAGSVGGQTLTGIPVVASLVADPVLAARSEVWPFTTGFDAPAPDPDAVVHAEIWPGIVALDPTLHPVRDAAQVIGLATHLADLDRAGTLGRWFDPPLDDATRRRAVDEEGWILSPP